jgi:Cu(I)/Ag(I) efflux system membrane protein CusA/SilA
VIERILEFCARYRALVLFAGLAFGLGGFAAMQRVKLDAIPDLSDSQVIVFTEWPGRSPTLIEDQVTYPLVTSLLGTPKVVEVRGQSMFGMSFVYVVFEEGTDAYWARSRVLEYLNTAQSRLPEGAMSRLGPDASGVGWVFQYALVDTSGKRDSGELRTLHDFSIRYALASVPGVSEIATVGGLQPEYQVTLDPERLRTYGLSLSDVTDAVRRASGDVGGRLIEMSEREYFVRGRGYLGKVSDLEAVTVRNDARGTPVLVKDVGSVRMGGSLRRGASDWNGQGDVVSGIVVMRHGENALEVISRVRERIAEVSRALPKGVEIKTAYDRSQLIKRSIDTLKVALIEEMIVVAAVILLFLLHFRSALLPIVSLPLAVLGAFIPMWLFDVPATIMSLGGIAIAIGATVDAEIVMVEAAHKRLEHAPGVTGDARRKLLAEAAREVTPAIFFSLLIIAVSFLPVFGLTGQAGKLFQPLAFTKTMVMLSAALLSITVAPALRDFLLKGHIRSEERHPISRAIRRFYEPFVHVALRNPRTTVLIGLFAVLSALPVTKKLEWEFMPPLDEGDLLYMPTTLPGISLDEARRQLQIQDAALRKFPEVESVLGKAGRAESATDPAPISMFETIVQLKPREKWRTKFERRFYHGWSPAFVRPLFTSIWPEFRHITRAELVDEMNTKLRFPGFTNAFTQPIRNRIDMLSTGIRTPIGVKIYGKNLEEIEKTGADIERIVKGVAGTRSVLFERQTGGLYLDVVPRREALARFGVSAEDVNALVESAVGGETVTTTIDGRVRYTVTVRYAESARSSVEAIREAPVSIRGTDAVRVADVADVRIADGPPMIKDESGLLVGYVYVDIFEATDLRSYVETAQSAVNAALTSGAIALPDGGRLRWTGQYELLLEMERRMKLLVPLALLVVVALLYLQFKNFTEVLIVLASVPFALVGSFWALYLLDYRLSTAVWVGVIALVGLAAQTGVVMIVYIDQAYHRRLREGRIQSLSDIIEAHAEGTIQRVRPKLMTVGTMLIGLLPLLWAEGSGADVMKRIAAPMVGGLITSAFLTLEIIPVIYTAWRYEELIHARLEGVAPALVRELDRYAWIARVGGFLLLGGAALHFWLEMKATVVGPLAAAGLAALCLAWFGYTWARRRALTIAFGGKSLPPGLVSNTTHGESHA